MIPQSVDTVTDEQSGEASNAAHLRLTSCIDTDKQFANYEELIVYTNTFAAQNGFQVIFKPSYTANEPNHRGVIKCWCFKQRHNTNEQNVTGNHEDSRKPRTKLISRHGEQRTYCQWYIRFAINADDLTYHFTTHNLVHCGHDPALDIPEQQIISSMRRLPAHITSIVSNMLRRGTNSEQFIKTTIEEDHEIKVNETVFHNLINRQRRLVTVPGVGGEMKQFFVWAYNQMRDNNAYASLKTGPYDVVERIFFMSQDMILNFRRNNEVIVMDTTAKTNRFGMPLCILCGVDQHHHVVLFAIALIAQENEQTFSWIFTELNKAAGDIPMQNIRSIITDGCKGMNAAMNKTIPHVRRRRCIWHIELNIADNTKKLLDTDEVLEALQAEHSADQQYETPYETFIAQWKHVVNSDTEDAFNRRKSALHTAFPVTVSYLVKNIWKNERMFVKCYLKNCTTLGVTSTQMVESYNAKLKKHLRVNSRTPVETIFERLRFAAEKLDRQHIASMEAKWNELQSSFYATSALTQLKAVFSVYVTNMIIEEYYHIDSYYAAKQANGEWLVTNNKSTKETPYTVSVTLATMSCSCAYPAMMLLPCRHVLKANTMMFQNAFQHNQVAPRWRMDYMPSLTMVVAVMTRRTVRSFQDEYPSVHFIKQPGTQTIRDRNTALNSVFNEIRALIVNDEERYSGVRHELILLIQRIRQSDCESTSTTDVQGETESPSVRYIGQVNEDSVQDPPVGMKRGRPSNKRTKSKGEQIKKQRLP